MKKKLPNKTDFQILQFIDAVVDQVANNPGEHEAVLRDIVYFLIKEQPIYQQQQTINWIGETFSTLDPPILMDENGEVDF